MGYYSTVDSVELVHEDILFSKDLLTRFEDFYDNLDPEIEYITELMSFTAMKSIDGKMKISVETTGEEGRAGYLDQLVYEFLKGLQEIFGVKFTLSYVIYGEENGDISKYVVSSDGSVSCHEAIISFEQNGDCYSLTDN